MTRHNMIIKVLGKEQEVRSNHTSIISTATAAAAAARAKRHAIQRKISRWLRPTSMIDGETKPTSKQYLTKTGLHRRTKDVLWCQELSRSGAAFLDFGAEECPYEVRFGMDVNLPRAGSGIRRKLIKIYTVSTPTCAPGRTSGCFGKGPGTLMRLLLLAQSCTAKVQRRRRG